MSIVSHADHVVAFWDMTSRGTLNTLVLAHEKKLPIDIYGPQGQKITIDKALQAAHDLGVVASIEKERKGAMQLNWPFAIWVRRHGNVGAQTPSVVFLAALEVRVARDFDWSIVPRVFRNSATADRLRVLTIESLEEDGRPTGENAQFVVGGDKFDQLVVRVSLNQLAKWHALDLDQLWPFTRCGDLVAAKDRRFC